MRGVMLTAFPDFREAASLETRLRQERANYRSSLRSAMQSVQTFQSESEADCHALLERARGLGMRVLRNSRDRWNAAGRVWSKRADDAVASIRNTENTYTQFMQLRAPVGLRQRRWLRCITLTRLHLSAAQSSSQIVPRRSQERLIYGQPCIMTDAFELRFQSGSHKRKPPQRHLQAVRLERPPHLRSSDDRLKIGRNMASQVESVAAKHHASGLETVTETVAAAWTISLIISDS